MPLTVEEFIEQKRNKLINREIRAKDITKQGYHSWIIEAVTFLPQSNYRRKVFVFERIRYAGGKCVPDVHKIGYKEYRIGYWIIGEIGNRANKWTWGQFCPFIPIDDFEILIENAKKDGTIPAVIKQPE